MWPKSYRDYKVDKPLKQKMIEPGKGIIGCEMHELNGWGNELHIKKKEIRKGWLARGLDYLFGKG